MYIIYILSVLCKAKNASVYSFEQMKFDRDLTIKIYKNVKRVLSNVNVVHLTESVDMMRVDVNN